jgi:hypothetical protein
VERRKSDCVQGNFKVTHSKPPTYVGSATSPCPCGTQQTHKLSVDDRDNARIERLLGTRASPPCLTSWVPASLENIVHRLFVISPLITSMKSQDDFTQSEFQFSMEAYKSLDIAHVRENFSKTSRQIPWFADRLGSANTKRRQLIAHARTRRMEFTPNITNDPARSIEIIAEHYDTMRCNGTNERNPSAHAEDHKPFHEQKVHSSSTSPSTESFEHECHDTQSCISGATSVICGGFSSDAIVPELSRYAQPGEPFVCPVCYLEQQVDSQSSWRYVCVWLFMPINRLENEI